MRKWEIEYVKNLEDVDIDDQSIIYDINSLSVFFEDFISSMIEELPILYEIESDILFLKFPFEFEWEFITHEILDYLKETEKTMISPLVDEVIKLSIPRSMEIDGMIAKIRLQDLEKNIKEVSKQSSPFTSRQIEAILKRFFKISLSSTERDILSQARKKNR